MFLHGEVQGSRRLADLAPRSFEVGWNSCLVGVRAVRLGVSSGGRVGQADFDPAGMRAQRLIRACPVHAFELFELARTI